MSSSSSSSLCSAVSTHAITTESSSIMSNPTIIVDDRTTHEKRLEKVKAREEKIKVNQTKAKELSRLGDEMVAKGDYTQACRLYSDAIQMWNTNVELYIKLATGCVKNRQYEQAAFTATRALTMSPKTIEARYQRGLARFEQKLFKAALIDFETILKHAPDHTLAATAIENVNACLASANLKTTEMKSTSSAEEKIQENVVASGKGEEEKSAEEDVDEEELDFEFPRHEEVELDLAELSDSEKCRHVGNRVPCRYYNRGKMGCTRGSQCAFSHAPDEKSVRDNLSRNVCLYLLLGTCRYENRCVYSHDKEWLSSTKGWWTDSAQIERMKSLVALAKKNARAQRELDRHLQTQSQTHHQQQRQLAQGQGHDRSRRSNRRTNSTDNTPNATGNGKGHAQRRHQINTSSTRQKKWGQSGPASRTFHDPATQLEERINNLGFTQVEVEELLCQGVKPWDDDAQDVLQALSFM
ncbi:Serine/threonine-protein phosphatase 5 [Leucoagaricus sp. SymC.cos]|nr:Serine/threonine-protein phosphatase 5 [Leucoagaricus sp. SymC.cos]